MNLERLYLDYNATSPLSKSVSDWLRGGVLVSANASSQHTSGKDSRKAINGVRDLILKTYSKSDKDTRLMFHSGATEAFMSIAYSFSELARLQGKDLLICYSKFDHPCITTLSEHYFGAHVKFLELSVSSSLEYEHDKNFGVLKDRKENNPGLIILYHHLWVHNETGIVSPLTRLARFKTIPDLTIHVDAVQAVGKIPDWRELMAGDIFTFSGHKFGALKGIGFSLFTSNIFFHPLLRGGGQQGGMRAGTENVTGIESLALALSDVEKITVAETYKLREAIEAELLVCLQGKGGIISSRSPLRNSNTIYFYLEKHSSDIALAIFDRNGLEVSAGSACSSGAARPSQILQHLNFKEMAKNGLRISLPYDPALIQKDLIVQKIRSVLQRL